MTIRVDLYVPSVKKIFGKIVIKSIKIFSIIIISTILILVFIGILAPKNTYFTKTQIIKGPISVVWRKLVDVENYPTWQPSVRSVVLSNSQNLKEGSILHFYMVKYDSTTYHEEKIINLQDDNALTCVRTGRNASPVLKDYQTNYSLKRLLDGTTEISVTISYNTRGFITKMYNQIYLRGAIGSTTENNLVRLRDSIERM